MSFGQSRTLQLSALCAFTALFALAALPCAAAASTIAPAAVRVCIDPGHGGEYTGAYYGGVAEKTLNLQIAERLKAALEKRGVQVSLTRTTDSKVYAGGQLRSWQWDSAKGAFGYGFWPATDADDRVRLDLQARCDRANSAGPDLFVSIHNNAAGSTATGIEVWRGGNDPLGQQFAEDVLASAVATTGAVNRGVKAGSYYVARWSNTPAVLVECGFMSNSAELARLRSASYRQRLAEGMAEGIAKFASRTVAEPYERVAGKNRWGTAVAVSKRSHPNGAGSVVLASGVDFPDALVAGPLASSLRAPLLITDPKWLPPAVADEIARLSPDRIIVVGGPTAVSSSVATIAAEAAGITTRTLERIAGRTRYETAVAVAKRMRSTTATSVIVASGVSWADALSIAPSAGRRGEPILLTHPSKLADATRQYLSESSKRPQITVVGGTSVVPDQVLTGFAFTRVSGIDRYETNWAVLKARFGVSALAKGIVASGESYADALVVGPLAASLARPVVLVGKSRVSSEIRPWVYANRGTQLGLTIAGGTPAVTALAGPSHEKWRMKTF